MSRSTPAGLVSSVGTATMVRQSGAMPPEKSRRGSRRGFTSSGVSQFISAVASWLAQSRKTSVNAASFAPRKPERAGLRGRIRRCRAG